MNMRILVLDDDETRLRAFRQKFIGTEVVTVMTASEAIKQLDSNVFQAIFLDHDLGQKHMVASGPGTGYEVAKWLENNPRKKPKMIYIHSFNPIGAQNMKKALPEAVLAPGIWSSR
jgi:CheY-like chemotaxis protein